MTEPTKPTLSPEARKALTQLVTKTVAAFADASQKVAADVQNQRHRAAIASAAVAAGAATELDFYEEHL